MAQEFQRIEPLTDAKRVPLIVARDLEVEYRLASGGIITAIQSLNWSVSAGEITSVVGPSGCGKSTLLRTVAGLQSYSLGALNVDLPPKHSLEDISMTFQSDVLLPWLNLTQNALLPFRIARRSPDSQVFERLAELLNIVGLTRFARAYPHELSGGMRMRAALVRAFLTEPRLVLMDEPFAALDELTRDRLCMELERLWIMTKNTIVYVTHNLSEAVFLSDKICLMSSRPGRITDEVFVHTQRPRDAGTRQTTAFLNTVEQVRNGLSNGSLECNPSLN